MNNDWKPDRAEVASAATQEMRRRKNGPLFGNIRGFPFTPKHPPKDASVWVKYSYLSDALRCEANTQCHVYEEISKSDKEIRRRFRVPRVFDFFEVEVDGFPCGLIVMEYVTGTPVSKLLRNLKDLKAENQSVKEKEQKNDCENASEDDQKTDGGHIEMISSTDTADDKEKQADPQVEIDNKQRQDKLSDNSEKTLDEQIAFLKNRVADAICFLLSFGPPPENNRPGPIGDGLIMHFAFGRDDCDAPREFTDVEDLQTFVNDKISKNWPDLPPAKFVDEGLKLCYCDLNFYNFILEDADDPCSRMIIIDFEHTSWLPYSFLGWELWDKREWDMLDRIEAQAGSEVPVENVRALYALLQQLTWDSGFLV